MVAVTAELDHLTAPAPMQIRRQLARIIALVALADTVVLMAGVFAAFVVKFGADTWSPTQVDWFTGVPLVDFGWLVPVWLGSLAVNDAYSRRQFAHGVDEFKTVLRGSLLAAGLVAVAAYLVNYDMSRAFYLYAFLIGTSLLVIERYVVRTLIHRQRAASRLLHRVVAIGDPDAVLELDTSFRRHPELGYQLVRVCEFGGASSPTEVCRAAGADTLIVTGGSVGSPSLRRLGWELEGTDIDLIVVPSLLDVAGPRIHTRPVAGLPLMHIEPPQVARALKWRKALFDRAGSASLLLLLAPVMLAVALAIRLDSRGPVFFRHTRIGVDGEEFGVWKFRSMVNDAHAHHADVQGDCAALLFKLKDDPRVTRVGAFIRRYSLDELPQLFNVLTGSMSLVGPRPQVAAEVAEYDDSAHRRLRVRPGITGLWQVSGRSDLTWEESVRLDLAYVDNWSMSGDVVILAKTLGAVLRHDGAY